MKNLSKRFFKPDDTSEGNRVWVLLKVSDQQLKIGESVFQMVFFVFVGVSVY